MTTPSITTFDVRQTPLGDNILVMRAEIVEQQRAITMVQPMTDMTRQQAQRRLWDRLEAYLAENPE